VRRLGILLAVLVAAGAPAAHAAAPLKGQAYTVHDHATPGDNWHVQVDVNRRGTAARVVVFSDRCGGNTPFAQHVPIAADGGLKTYRDIVPGKPDKGTWSFEARFTETPRLDGTFRITTPDCDSGPMVFVAKSGMHIHYGVPWGRYPDLARANRKHLAEAQHIYEQAWKWARRFRDIDHARELGMFSGPADYVDRRAHVYHLRHLAWTKDKVYFSAKKPESVMYYNGLDGRPVLIGYMFRYPLGKWPPFARPLLGWHAHGSGKWRGVANQMTHVWLTNDLRSALANCQPVEALEAALPEYEFSPMQPDVIQEAQPCPTPP